MVDLNIESEIIRQVEEYEDRRGKLPDNIIISRAVQELHLRRNPYLRLPIHPKYGMVHKFVLGGSHDINVTILDSDEFIILVG
ncbi:hypothetical protein phi18_050 [Bacillus phage phi18]|nr:hypothetical protein Goe10_c00480 [Bacillus phage vB_BsuM-Goe10]UAV84320.1 hypothetical protein phi18_050 [Bacillus phage phi18]